MTKETKDSAANHTEPNLSRPVVYVMIALSGLLGGIGQTVLIFFLFFGSLTPINLNLSKTAGSFLNAGLCLAFFLQHSVMLRKPFRRWMATFINPYYHGALFTIVTGIVLVLIVLFWQKSSCIIVVAHGVFYWLMRIVALLAVAGTVWTFHSLDSFDPFGLNVLLAYLRGENLSRPRIHYSGPYGWVRHPLYFFLLLMIWTYPYITPDRLLFNVLFTIWIYIGTVMEERDLVADFGAVYQGYQDRVPMLLPKQIRPVRQADSRRIL
jgi:protein-S-isoprenylcysteine O-methyltransferase Ste14